MQQETLSSRFWSPSIWLPPNVSWEDFDGKDNYAQFSHLLLPLPLAFLFIIIRSLLEKGIFRPLGIWLKIPHHPKSSLMVQPLLEKNWQSCTDVKVLSRTVGLSEIEVERWLRKRKAFESRVCHIRKSEILTAFYNVDVYQH